jgi:DNA-binding NtrC family response regulator
MNAKEEIVGKTPQMLQVFSFIDTAAKSDATVLIQGESGVGKELVAQTIHERSRRCQGPFMPISCAGLNQNLLESELFGHEKGAFTGAIRAKRGKIELADSGTLLLDDVDDIPLESQVKLIRFLQTFEFERVGGVVPINVDIRVIAAAKRDLAKMVAEGRFRDDLYYRLKVLFISVPPLRERKEDIPLLVEHFLSRYAPDKEVKVTPEAMELLIHYNWMGNVRQLENTIQRMVATSTSPVLGIPQIPNTIRYSQIRHLMDIKPANERLPFDELVQQTERQLIFFALEQADWNKTRAAEILEMKRGTLISKMKKLGIPLSKSDE